MISWRLLYIAHKERSVHFFMMIARLFVLSGCYASWVFLFLFGLPVKVLDILRWCFKIGFAYFAL